MKTTTVPAQITTVEDKIAGNLSLSQLLLLAAPVFVSSAAYVVVPKFLHLTTLKIILCTLIFLTFGILAIRVRGKLILVWAILVFRYRLRPRYYLFDKNDSHLRSPVVEDRQPDKAEETVELVETELLPVFALATPELVRLEMAIADPRANFMVKANRRGDLDVYITEIK